jgi:hypothetical protein
MVATSPIRETGPSAASTKHETVTVLVPQTTLTVEFDDGDTRAIRRTTIQPVRSIKGQRPRTATSVS